MFGEHEKVWQAIWRITTGKYLPVLRFLILYIFKQPVRLTVSFARAEGAAKRVSATIVDFISI
jgi:hypothetical protein